MSLIAGGTLVLPNSAIDTGTAALTLQALGGDARHQRAAERRHGYPYRRGRAHPRRQHHLERRPDLHQPDPARRQRRPQCRSSRIDLQGGVNGAGNSLTLTSTNGAADAIHTGAAIANTAQFAVTGNSTLGGNVTTSGNQTYTGTVTLASERRAGLGRGEGRPAGASTRAGGIPALTSSNAAADAIRAGMIPNAASSPSAARARSRAASTTTGAQLYSDTVTLGGTANFALEPRLRQRHRRWHVRRRPAARIRSTSPARSTGTGSATCRA